MFLNKNSGKNLIINIITYHLLGVYITFFLYFTDLYISLATKFELTVNIFGNFNFLIILVFTYPGITVITLTPFDDKRFLRPDKNAVRPAFDEP